MTGRIVFVDWITRGMVQAHPEARFVFGDNLDRVGLGGQAGAMRGEPNAIGVATKRHPGSRFEDFFYDSDEDAAGLIDADLQLVWNALLEGRTVYVPQDGLGTGLSELPTRAPGLHHHIVKLFHFLASETCPWPLLENC